jgi:biotin transporter BioY
MERGLTLGDFLIPIRLGERAASWQRDLLLVISGALLITAGAYVSFQVPAIALGNAYVPVNPYVPFSLQTFGVLFTGALLGYRRGIDANRM